MPQKRLADRGFSLFQWTLIATLVTALVLLVLFTGYSVTHRQQTQQFMDDSQKLRFETGLRAAELRNVRKSLLGMHYASDEFAGADIAAFAVQLRQYLPAIHSLGMAEHVDGSMRGQYERWMSEERGEPFDIHQYEPPSGTLSAGIRDAYLPIISIDTMNADERGLLGTDLKANAEIARQMSRIVASGEAMVAPIPPGWPMSGNTLLVQPVYYDEQSPEAVEDRVDLYAGAIWISIDLYEFLMKDLGSSVRGTITLQVRSVDDAADVIEQGAALGEPEGIDVGYGALAATSILDVGASRVTLTFERQALMPMANATVMLGACLILLVFSGLAIAFAYHLRIAQQHRLDSLRVISEERENAERTLESINDAVISLDASLVIIYMNPSARRFLEVRDDSPLEGPFEEHVRFGAADAEMDGDAPPFPGLGQVLEALGSDGREQFDVALSLPHLAGSTVKLTVSRMQGIDGRQGGCILVLEDVSKERKLSNELEFRANHDSLTGCYNRFYFDKHLARLVDDVAASGRSHALCYIDLDQFKIVNDTCGHASGDRLLCELTEELRRRLRTADVLARLGGDEFGVIIRDARVDDALRIANELFTFFQNFVFEHEGKAFSVHASIGFVAIDRDRRDLQKIMAAADVACYTAKDSGRNALVVYSDTDEAMSERKNEMNWLPTLKRALSEDDFFLLVQAIADIDPSSAETRITHYEFLLRLKGPGGEVISPLQFISAAERYDLMKDIDRWVIRNAFGSVSAAHDSLPPRCSFSINLSGQSAADPTLLTYIAEQLKRHDVDPQRIWFEITETAAITNFSNAVSLIEGIQSLGAQVALDDFGSGLSSFGYLSRLPVNVLKIDGQFIKNIDSNRIAREMVRSMDHVGKAMGLKTVAEFVESEAVVKTLADIGVDYAQGYFIAEPCSLEEALRARGAAPFASIEQWVEEHREAS